ncbi:MAG TPA: HTH-type transcriptional repressor FabR [bacterium]|nr:HTH-type transcriptional repressor FabR [bacterium]
MFLKSRDLNGKTRAGQKAVSRRSLVDAAIGLSARHGFAGLSLREVCREAGLAPTAFYRHFRDMDDLGLALVDEVALSLRRLMREARRMAERQESRVEASAVAFIDFIRRNANLFRILMGERLGSSPAFRKSLRREMNLFVNELAEDLQRAAQQARRPLADPMLAAEAIVAVVFTVGAEALDLPSRECKKLTERLIKEIRLILIGSESLARARSGGA